MAQPSNQKLPIEIVNPIRFRSIILSIIWVVILVIIANFAAKWYLEKYTTNRGEWLIRAKWELLLNLQKPVDWLILGDSSCNQGVVPSVFNKVLNTTSINLCTIGNLTSLNDAWMLETYLKKFKPPQHILVVHVPEVWSRQFQTSLLAKIPLQWGDLQQLEPHLQLSFKQQLRILLEKYLPLYSSNRTLAKMVMFPLDSFKISSNFKLEDDGFMIWNQANPSYVEQQKTEQIELLKNHEFQISSHNRLAIDKFIDLAEKFNFDIYLANSPIYKDLYENEQFQAYFNQVQKTLNAYADRTPRVHHIQKPITFAKEQMENADHVIYDAAKVYTKQLITEIISLQK
ncbi:hypothetical protein WA1_16095 [Scytonema hofmannii PCC 7110]|uniref:SGNH/GDSL hydrolase family protein n=1 Tax=Scytonema hofmannii PCC 7110 TaxID=128403 RepID=A0A139XA57_9CYAN|nr:hypothetical protein WA1_16095 [Scytonema hofmannii PCC 7110]